MDPQLIGIAGLAVAGLLLLLGVPIAFVMFAVGGGGILILKGPAAVLSMLATQPFATNTSYILSVLPLFILMGAFCFNSGVTDELFLAARLWVGRVRGGLLLATVAAATVFSAASGASVATVAIFGKMAVPELLKYGYDKKMSLGCVAAAGLLDALIPPSVIIVIYALLAEESVGRLLIAGIFPGLLTASLFAMMIFVRATLNPRLGPPITGITWRESFVSLRGVWGISALVILVLGGIYTGVFTPTEAAAAGAMGAFLLMVAKRKLGREALTNSLLETLRTSAIVFLIITGAVFFARFVALTGLAKAFTESLVALPLPPHGILLAIMFLYLVLGCMLEPMGMMFLTLPFVLPVIKALGFDPIWFGILLVQNIGMGLITPPIGVNVFTLKGVLPDMALGDIFQGATWFLLMEAVALAILIAFPEIALWLPNQMMGR